MPNRFYITLYLDPTETQMLKELQALNGSKPNPVMREAIRLLHASKFNGCKHTNTTVDTTGTLRFEGGDVVDTLYERIVCTDCGVEIDPPVTTTPEIPY